MKLIYVLLVLLFSTAIHGASFAQKNYYGTLDPFASESVYFLMTDRFVNGDETNDHRKQGCSVACTWHQKIPGKNAFIGYMGGDFKGILDNSGYIRDMGFSSIWITPVIDNPDQAYTGDIGGKDNLKAGYHGYWGVNYFKEDEHLISKELDFQTLATKLKEKHGIKVILDIVPNHGSHGFGMTEKQYQTSTFGRIYDENGRKICDHQNKPRLEIIENRCFQGKSDGYPYLGVPLAEFDQSKTFITDYLERSFLHWINKGAAAFRIDTVKHVPEPYLLNLARKIRARHPGFYIFGEYFEHYQSDLARFQNRTTINVLDFAGRKAMNEVFTSSYSSYSMLQKYLDLNFSEYQNPYNLATFYDNHDVARLNADDNGFIDAHNWLFTTRGIPVLYYGSETGFQRGKSEHEGNRNYYGIENIKKAREHKIYRSLKKVVKLRQSHPALQRGLQVNVFLKGDIAAFYRVYQYGDVSQTALVLLNKSDEPAEITVKRYLNKGKWFDALSGKPVHIADNLKANVHPHGIRVFVNNDKITNKDLIEVLDRMMKAKKQASRRQADALSGPQ